MQIKKRRLATCLTVIILLALAIVAALPRLSSERQAMQEGNLIKNGDFSSVTDGMPDGWSKGMWVTGAGASYLEAVTLEGGTTAALVENAAQNDARFEQTVSVRENAIYRLSARVRAEGCDADKVGANLSFLGIYGTSESAHDTDGEWTTLTLYASTGKGQREATVCVRLGGYGSEASGKAWFTDVELTQVDSVPIGVQVLDIAPRESSSQSSSEKAQSGNHAIPVLVLAALAYVLIFYTVVNTLLRANIQKNLDPKSGWRVSLALILVAAGALRVVLAFLVEGYGVDMGCFTSWAMRMAEEGPAGFYTEGYFCDYPPAYMLVLGLFGGAARLFGFALHEMFGQALLKLVPIACDLTLAAIVFVAASREAGRRPALGLAALIAFNPALIVTGSCWGQIDALLAVLLALVLLAARDGRWHVAIPLFALAVLTKPQAGLLAPLGVAALIKELVGPERRQAGKSIAVGIGAGVLVALAIVLPFSIHQESPLWIVDKYVSTLSSYAYATLSTGNLMFLLGGNWVSTDTALIGSMTYGDLGTANMIVSFIFGIVIYLRGEGRSRLMLASAVTMQAVFCLGTKMHERYVVPALALLMLAYIETGDVRVLVSGVMASAASAVNIGVVLAYDYLIAPNLWLGYAIAFVQLIQFGRTFKTAVALSRGKTPMRFLPKAEQGAARDVKIPEDRTPAAKIRVAKMLDGEAALYARRRAELLQPQDYKLHMARRDWAIMLAITAVYAVVGFWGLGVTSAPQGGYASTAAGETVVFDLGENRTNFHIYYYGGVSNTAFSFAVSDDGVNYMSETPALFKIGTCYKWMAMRQPIIDADGKVNDVTGGMLGFSGRYVRLTFDNAGAALWEVAFVDENGAVLPVAGATASGAYEGRQSDPMTLIDEQDTVPMVPSYLNSMYFDEIYHARTGYEHAHAQYAYENTHPPLGKVFMSWCILLMGMTPFAWRFAGALAGVLMLPALYVLARQLFGKARWAALCTLLMAADCMHYTQTRIATIDSFPVLFMIVMFFFMLRWMRMSFYHQSLGRTFVPLALSGIFMGLAIASKWIGCYGAVGLAVLFFARMFTLWRQSVWANAHRNENKAFARAADMFAKNAVLTLAACVVFFVIVPVLIYAASFIPYLRAYGPIRLNMTTLQRLWDAQVTMFRYHSGLNETHSFSSMWYEWPLIVKPMWYYKADFKGVGMASTILSFGNPAVWWTGFVSIVFVLCYSLYRNALPSLHAVPAREDAYDRAMPLIAVGFLSAYLPWVLVSRLTFIYHYFASVPFIILATAQGLRYIERRSAKLAHALMALLVSVAIALFIAFFPLASGIEVPRAWCDAMNWFEGWMRY